VQKRKPTGNERLLNSMAQMIQRAQSDEFEDNANTLNDRLYSMIEVASRALQLAHVHRAKLLLKGK
jgi:hypothetical protein